MADVNSILLINNSIKYKWIQSKDRDFLTGYKKQAPTIYCPQETYSVFKDTNTLRVQGWKRYIMQIAIIRKLDWLY